MIKKIISYTIIGLSLFLFGCIKEKQNPLIYTVSYSANEADSGNAPVDETEYVKGDVVIIKSNVDLIKKGYTFGGWNTLADDTGSILTPNQTFIMSASNITIYAYWTKDKTFSITYDGNGGIGSVPIDNTSYESGTYAIIKANIDLSKVNHTFVGWNTATDGSGTYYSASGSNTVIVNNDIILYAQWTALPTYKILYFGNNNDSGDVPVDNTNYQANTSGAAIDNINNLKKSGYRFIKWNTKENGSGIDYVVGQLVNIENFDVFLYAQWEKTYSVVYSNVQSNGGDVPIDNNTYISGEFAVVKDNTGNLTNTSNVETTDNLTTNTPCTFNKWNTQSDGSGTSYAVGQNLIVNSDVVLYPQWNPTFTVTYHNHNTFGTVVYADSGSAPIDNGVYNVSNSFVVQGNIGNLQLGSLIFIGWSLLPGSPGTLYNEGYSLKFLDGRAYNLYPYWSDYYTVTYYANGASGSVPVDNYKYISFYGNTSTSALGLESLSYTGYSFSGWNKNSDGSGDYYYINDTVPITGSVSLYAQWHQSFLMFDVIDATSYSVKIYGGTPTDNVYIPKYYKGKLVTLLTQLYFSGKTFKYITVPNSVTNIVAEQFSNCKQLINANLSYPITTFGNGVFTNCYLLQSVSMPTNLTKIPQNTFFNCYALTDLCIPVGAPVTTIDWQAYRACYALTNIIVPAGVTTINGQAFYDGKYTAITFPASLTSLGSNVVNSPNVKSIKMLGAVPPTMAVNGFGSLSALVTAGCKIYVPSLNINTYKTATNWSAYASIIVGY